jgi:hypothetical protein
LARPLIQTFDCLLRKEDPMFPASSLGPITIAGIATCSDNSHPLPPNSFCSAALLNLDFDKC